MEMYTRRNHVQTNPPLRWWQGHCPLPPWLAPAVWLPPWLQFGWLSVMLSGTRFVWWRLPCLPNRVTATIWEPLGVGFGFWGEGCKRVGVHGLNNALKRVATICGWLAPNSGVNGAPPGHLCSGCFLSFPLLGLHPPRVTATQAHTDFTKWHGFCAVGRYCSTQNPSTVGGSNIYVFARRSFVCGHICIIFLGLDHNGWWRPSTTRQPQSPWTCGGLASTIHLLNIRTKAPWVRPRFGGVPYTHRGRSHNFFLARHVRNRAAWVWDCSKCGQYRWGLLCLGLFMWACYNSTSQLGCGVILFAVWVTCFH